MSIQKPIRKSSARALLATAFTLFASTGVAQAQSFVPAPGSPYSSVPVTKTGRVVAVGDFNNDGRLDFATANANTAAAGLTVYLQNANGSFTSPPGGRYTTGVPVSAFSITVADLDLDGNLDVIVGGASGFGIGFGDGKGNFTFPAPVHSNPDTASKHVVGDFNGDGTPDIVVINAGTGPQPAGGFGLFLGQGNRQFDNPTFFVEEGAYDLAAGDVNGDGKLDLVELRLNNTVAVLLGNGAGGFSYAGPVAGFSSRGANSTSLKLADYNGDGKKDVLILSSLAGVY